MYTFFESLSSVPDLKLSELMSGQRPEADDLKLSEIMSGQRPEADEETNCSC